MPNTDSHPADPTSWETTPSRESHRLLKAFVAAGMAVSLLALVGELYWKSLNSYEQSSVLSKTFGRQQIIWDLRTSRNPEVLGKPMHVGTDSGATFWTWSGPMDVTILLPGGRELKTDTLDISVSIEKGEISDIAMNGGSELNPVQMRQKMLEEIRTMRPTHRGDGVDCKEALDIWQRKLAAPTSVGGSTPIWSISGKPDIVARIHDLSGAYIVQYELSW